MNFKWFENRIIKDLYIAILIILGFYSGYFFSDWTTGVSASPQKIEKHKISFAKPHKNIESEQPWSEVRFKQFYDKGIEKFYSGDFARAAYYFEYAAAMKPNDTQTRYYLMLSYANTEHAPYARNSKAIRQAEHLLSISHDTYYSRKASDLIESKGISVSKRAVKIKFVKPNDKKPKKTVNIENNEYKDIPNIPETEPYPVASREIINKRLKKGFSNGNALESFKNFAAEFPGIAEIKKSCGLP